MLHRFKLFFSLNTNTVEYDAVREYQPDHLLMSFARFRNVDLGEVFTRIGYRPKTVMVDSGAFTFAFSKKERKTPEQIGVDRLVGYNPFRCGYDAQEIEKIRQLVEQPINRKTQKNDPIFLQYMRWVHHNRQHIDYCLAMDVIGDPWLSLMAYRTMRQLRFPVVPVYHRGSCPSYLEAYAYTYPPMIALGGTAIRSDNKKKGNVNERAEWASPIVKWAPFPYHMLGTQDPGLIFKIPGIASCDGTTWAATAQYSADKGESRLRFTVNKMKEIAQKFVTMHRAA